MNQEFYTAVASPVDADDFLGTRSCSIVLFSLRVGNCMTELRWDVLLRNDEGQRAATAEEYARAVTLELAICEYSPSHELIFSYTVPVSIP